jgi:hypothetical protein
VLKVLVSVLALAALAYMSIAAALYFAQTSIFFPARIVPPAGPLPPGAERIELTASDGIRLEGVLIPRSGRRPTRTRRDPRLCRQCVKRRGNRGISRLALSRTPGRRVPLSGYAPSGGAPSAAALLDDAPLAYDLVRKRLKPNKLVVVGISIGSGVAAGLSARRPLDGLVLVTPFDSLEEVARQRFPWLPVSWLIRHKLPSAETLRGSPVPVAIVAAEHDGVVPPARTAALAAATGNLVSNVTIPGTPAQ